LTIDDLGNGKILNCDYHQCYFCVLKISLLIHYFHLHREMNNNIVGRSSEEEEGVRASEKIDRILSHLSNSEVVVRGKPRV
jgi:hypothetical protein